MTSMAPAAVSRTPDRPARHRAHPPLLAAAAVLLLCGVQPAGVQGADGPSDHARAPRAQAPRDRWMAPARPPLPQLRAAAGNLEGTYKFIIARPPKLPKRRRLGGRGSGGFLNTTGSFTLG